jgi:dTDP-4-dehydrorhamnose reductase
MLGHKLWQTLAGRFDIYVSMRQCPDSYAKYGIFDPERVIDRICIEDFDSIIRAIEAVHPEVLVNCIGIVKQIPVAKDPLVSISINALFPHRLARLCRASGARLIHISTDCVFSGRKGNYVEGDLADAEDLYGRTKFLGEVSYEGCLTIRTSMIGRELATSHGLVEWFLSQEGRTIKGYERAIFSGFTTIALSEVIVQVITEYPDISGIWHVASEPISKFELLSLVKRLYGLNIRIEPDETVVCDRSLNADRFRRATGLVPPKWEDMIQQMCKDTTPYSQIRKGIHAD